ncbi:RND family efflux transporter, MFP subunit [Flexibacter flexilis DSM 6793]|uniref:RND family efflux transporter, MFP subunit n=1 Tax=Flexibacter flexilis DSM 6793 TaxID=927664 RepID=A0A1I1G9R0_9BACT|nr:efflux RND transporter periplasmic adaptor subunit [Flexibacter flexilis]SFC08126.1 RND family efflux transporter, MFP subunit [Flexibacter flexilis DSM 6793]
MKSELSIIKAQALVGVGLAVLSACGSKHEQGAVEYQSKLPAVPVVVGKASTTNTAGISASGQVEALQTANISTRLMGFITSIKVKVGDRVHKGQVLATISSQEISAKRAQAQAMITEAEAAVNNAQKDYDRFTTLLAQGSATPKEMENVTFQLNSAKAHLEAAKQMRNEADAMLAYATLKAPFDGIITQKMADEGNMAAPGMPLLSLEENDGYQVRVTVPESDIEQVREGATATVNIKSTGKQLKGRVTQISESSQFTGGQYAVKISLDNPKGLYAGMYVNVNIEPKQNTQAQAETEATLVPVSSVVYRDQLTGVYTVSQKNTAMLRWVRLGKTFGDKVEVVSGLDKDESFILKADGKLANGTPVKTN